MSAVDRLRDDRSGVAMVEFALSLPVLMILGLGGLDTGRYVFATLRCEQIAMTVADNAGRVRHALDETDVNEVMIGGRLMGQGVDFATNGRIILSDLEQRTTTTGSSSKTYLQWIRWQRCSGALNKTSSYGFPLDALGAPVTNLDAAVKNADNTVNPDHGAVETASVMQGMGPVGHQIVAAPNTAAMVVEVFYKFTPVSPYFPLGTDTIHVVQAFNIRQRSDFSVYNANKVGKPNRSDCRDFSDAIPS